MSTDTTTKKQALRPLEVGVGAGAAVITALASSFLGTAGTLSGAALASVVGTVSTSLLRSSAERSAERLRETTARLHQTRTGSMPEPTDVRPVEDGSDPAAGTGTPLLGAPDPGRTGARKLVRPQWVLLGVGAVIAFAVSLVLITGIESAVGEPLASLVGKDSGGGTSVGILTGNHSGSTSTDTTPASPSPTATTSGGATPSATETPSGSPTGAPSATGPAPTGAPSATAPAPSATVPAPTGAPSASPEPVSSRTS